MSERYVFESRQQVNAVSGHQTGGGPQGGGEQLAWLEKS